MNAEDERRHAGRLAADAEKLGEHSESVRRASLELRRTSNRLLAAIDELRGLEARSRTVPVGSPEFERLSADVAARARAVFAMAGEQQSLAESLPGIESSLEQMDQNP